VIELLDVTLSEYLRANISAKATTGGVHLLFLRRRRPRPHLWLYRRRRLQGRGGSRLGRRILGLWLRLRGFEYRYDKSVDLGVAQFAHDEAKAAACRTLQDAWAELAAKVIDEFVINGFKPQDVLLIPGFKMQYMGNSTISKSSRL